MRARLTATFLLFIPALLPASARAQPTPTHDQVTIAAPWDTFRIDRHEVTIAQFRAFATATGLKTKAENEGGGRQYLAGWQHMPGWTWQTPYGRPGRDDEPAVHITFHEATAYCRWAGLRLPTEREWLAAAYTERRADPPKPFQHGKTYPYPTGNSPADANQADAPGHRKIVAPQDQLGHGRGHLPVKSLPAGVNGLYDMGANVWEWVDNDTNGLKRTRGGSWWYGPAQMRADAIYDKPPDFPAVYIGFRCAAR